MTHYPDLSIIDNFTCCDKLSREREIMAVTTLCAISYLTGDWTIAGIVRQVPRLTEYQFNDGRADNTIAIDCSGIEKIDLHGFELLHVWLHCIKLRGLRTKLVNMPEWMREPRCVLE